MQKILINGLWVDALNAVGREIKNPATLQPLDTVPDCAAEDVERAVTAAKTAQQPWWQVPSLEKRSLLRRIGERILERRELLATLMTQETGMPLGESSDSVRWAAACFEHHSQITCSRDDKRVPIGSSDLLALNDNEPFGVIAVITPANFPLLLMAWRVAQTIAAGNTVVCKPPHQNPLASLKLAEIYDLLPPGVVNVITGGADTAMALVQHPGIDLVMFTGSTAVGRQIAAATGTQPKKVALQSSSAQPIIVLHDADLDTAVAGVAWARLRHSGQDCTSNKRIYVDQAVAAEFADRIHEYMAYLEVGDPLKPDTDLGPLVSHEAARRVEEQVAHAVKAGARLKLGGRCFRPWGLPGHFFQPTILTNVPRENFAAHDDIFGPVLSITSVANVEEAIRLAFDAERGCNASIYTRAPQLTAHALEAFKGKTLWVKDSLGEDNASPVVQMRRSGVGLEFGNDLYQSPVAHLEHIVTRKPWWFPYRERKLDFAKPSNS